MTSFANTHGRLHAYMEVVISSIANMSLSPSLLFPHGRWLDVNVDHPKKLRLCSALFITQ